MEWSNKILQIFTHSLSHFISHLKKKKIHIKLSSHIARCIADLTRVVGEKQSQRENSV